MSLPAVYLDYQASTPLDPRVREVMFEAYCATGNASSEEHAFGWVQAERIDRSRRFLAELIGSLPEEIVFTSGATEANNLAILGASSAAPQFRRRIVVSAIEHKSVSEAACAAEERGFSVDILPVRPDGLVDIGVLAGLLNSDVAVVSIMAVNNEIGTIQPIREIGEMVRAAGAFFHVDATQAPVAIEIDVVSWGADAISLSAHKIYGPGGIGALYIALDAPWRPKPLAFGGGQEAGLRPGTIPAALCAGFGEACRILTLEGAEERSRVAALRNRLGLILSEAWPGLIVTCDASPRHPGCLHVRVPELRASDILMRLQPRVAASTGSACTSGVIGPSHVLVAIGLTQDAAFECIRFSVGRFTTDAELAFAGDVWRAIIRDIVAQRQLS